MGPDGVVPHWYMYPPKCVYSDRGSIPYDGVPIPRAGASIYVHVPFCDMKCSFCSLYTSAGYSDNAADLYVKHLVREIDEFVTRFPHVRSPNIYFGGGTPALLSDRHLKEIMDRLRPVLSASMESQSVEFSPNVATKERIVAWRDQGFDRVSVGIQSFNDERLSIMRRHHDGMQALEAIERLSHAGFEKINIDLIFGGHGQTLRHWRKDIEIALLAGADSCTFHPLALVSKTPFERKLDRSEVGTSNTQSLHNEAVQMFIAAGWKRTSAISFSRTGSPNPLERAEADGVDTFGFGAGARSYLGSLHISTLPSLKKMSFGAVLKAYYEAVDRGEKPALSAVKLSEEEIIRRALILNLHHGRIDKDMTDAVSRFEKDSKSLRDLEAELEPLAASFGVANYRIRDSALPKLASLGIGLASKDVQLSVLRMLDATVA